MVRSGVPAPSLAPLLGTNVVRERGGVRYHELQARSLLGRCTSPRVSFDWTANPYRGCAFGCRYCYAAYTHGHLDRDGATEFRRSVRPLRRSGAAAPARPLGLIRLYSRPPGQERMR